MLFYRKRQKNDDILNFTAMVDVVFLLLIFFLCTSSLKLPESQIKAALPGRSLDVPEFPPVQIEIRFRPGDSVQVLCDGRICRNDDFLLAEIQARSVIADIPVVFAIDEGVVFEDVVRVMDICRAGGLKRLALPAGG